MLHGQVEQAWPYQGVGRIFMINPMYQRLERRLLGGVAGGVVVLFLYGGGGSINSKGIKFDATTHLSLSPTSSPTRNGGL